MSPWRLLAWWAVPRRALDGAWPRPAMSLWYFDYRMREVLMPALRSSIYDESPFIGRARELGRQK